MLLLKYEIRRSGRKTLSVKIEPDGSVVALAPGRMPKAAIDDFVQANASKIAAYIERAEERLRRYPPIDEEQKKELWTQALEHIPKRVAYYASVMGVFPSSVRITGAEKRFGSCSGKNGLCFSYRLMRYPFEAIDYVVVHELAHIRHKNHKSSFYREIERVLPDYRQREVLLK
ncbi:MAG: M48 family metallopeptidase [Clostridiaceae bacterium]|nr:M48 family metallopeptidase [Clostridiaceae bacterium]